MPLVNTQGIPITQAAGSIVPSGPAIPIEQTAAQRQAAVAAAGQNPAPSVTTVTQQAPPVEPTVLSSGNVQDKYVPELNNRLAAMGPRQTYTDQGGFLRYSDDGSLAQAPADASPNGNGGWDSGGDTYATGPTFTGDPTQDALLQGMMKNLDAQTRASINSITTQGEILKQQQAQINAAAEAGTQQALLLGGSSRYAPISSTGTVQTQQSYGIQKIAALDAQEQQQIAAAQAAQQSGNYQIMEKALTTAENIRQEKQAEATKIADTQRQQIEDLRTKQIQSSRDNAIADLVSQGVTDPSQILGYLNYDDKGNTTGDFTAQEIGDTLKSLTINGTSAADLKSDLGTFQYLQKNNMLPTGITNLDPNQQYFAYLNMQKLANDGKLSAAAQQYGGGIAPSNNGNVIGVGAKDSTEEQIIRMRLFSKLSNILNKGQLSDSDAERINGAISTLRSAGKSEQEIMDSLSGFSDSVKTPYNSAFRDLIVGNTDTIDQQNQTIQKISTLLASGNNEGAMKTVENVALNNAKKLDPANYMGSATATTYLSNIDKVRSDLADGGVTGFVGGSLQNVLGRVKGPKTATLKADITNLVAQFRHDLLGSAVTESEKAFLTDLIPDISSSNFIEQLNAFQNGILSRYNGTRTSVNLPEVDYQQALDPEKRLSLYATDTTDSSNPFTQALGGTSTSSVSGIYSPDQGYVIPQ